MNGPHVAVSQVLDARPEAIYQVLSNYKTEHPQILPKAYFTSVVVEEGGIGAGTVVRMEMNVAGQKSVLRLQVTEPVPGRVLQEEDPAAGLCTTFTLTPQAGGTRVEFATVWRPQPGLPGLIQRLLTPILTRPIYRQELALLAAYLRQVG